MATITSPYQVTRGAGDTITLGHCGACGRKLSLSAANKTGARCRYDGAQFNAAGELLYFSGRNSYGTTWKRYPTGEIHRFTEDK